MSKPEAAAYRHKEAFALMWYGCDCGHRERMWNSRDGVTPFCLSCPSCGGLTLTHTDWRADRRAPDHVPYGGQRVWRNGSPAEAATIMSRRIAAMRAAGREVDEAEAERMIEDARSGQGGFTPGWPTLTTVVERGRVPGG